MTLKEQLLQEFECAIEAIFGGDTDKEFNIEEIDANTLNAIARKVAFYLDLD